MFSGVSFTVLNYVFARKAVLPIEVDLCESKEDSNIDPDGTEKVSTKMKDIRLYLSYCKRKY